MVLAATAKNLHELGLQDPTCVETIDDESDDPLLDENGNPLCAETVGVSNSIVLIEAIPNIIALYDFQQNDPEYITPTKGNAAPLSGYRLGPASTLTTPSDNFIAAKRTSTGQTYQCNNTSAGEGDDLKEDGLAPPAIKVGKQIRTGDVTVIFTFSRNGSATLMALYHQRQSFSLQAWSSYATSTRFEMMVRGTSSFVAFSTEGVLDDKLHVVAWRLNSSKDVDYWFDGVKGTSQNLGTVLNSSGDDLFFGDSGGWSSTDSDDITTDLFVAYSTALTDTEIEDICNAIVAEII